MQSFTMDVVNQVKSICITDSIAVARLLNATLVVPELDHRSYWKDPRFVSTSLCLT
jgi:hypothetical protein